jgi:hypothetical protein
MSSLENLSAEERAQLTIGRLTATLLKNPETRDATAKLLRSADKSLQFPDVDSREELTKVQQKSKEAIDALENRLRERDAKDQLAKYHEMIKSAGFDVAKVNELMEKIGIPSTEAGYKHVIDHLNAQAQVAEPSADQIQPFRMPDTKEMWNDPVKWRENEGYKVLNELIAQRKRA